MDYEELAAALETRFTGVTPPSGEEGAQATDEPPDQVGFTPLVVVDLPPVEDLDWGPAKQRFTRQLWTVWALFAQEGDYSIRKHRLAKWQKALVNQVAFHVQLGLVYVRQAYITHIEPAQPDWADVPYDGLRISVQVDTREVVTGAAA